MFSSHVGGGDDLFVSGTSHKLILEASVVYLSSLGYEISQEGEAGRRKEEGNGDTAS